MTEILAEFMTHPLTLMRWQQMLLLWPLCLAISLVYKTIKCPNIREIPQAVLVSWITIIVGMYAVGVVLLLVYEWAT